MILVFTAVHNAFPTAMRTISTIDLITPAPFVHYIGDDFSSPPDSDFYASLPGDIFRGSECVGERRVYRCDEIGGVESPNLGLSVGNMFEVARREQPEALWIVESDVIPRAGIVDAFREAQRIYGEKTGAITPLFTSIGGNRITSFGGMGAGKSGGEDNFLDLEIGQEIGSWEQEDTPRLDHVWWSHMASMWIPISTINMKDENDEYVINPDPEFSLYYCDFDLSYQITRKAKLDLVISDKAIAGHSRCCASTGLRWPDQKERMMVELEAKEKVNTKWGIT